MKKILLSALAVFAFSFANAQEQEIVSSKGENYLPQQGDWSIGFSANSALSFVGNAFNGSTGNSVAFDKNDATKLPGFANSVSFLGKNFTEDKKADRLGKPVEALIPQKNAFSFLIGAQGFAGAEYFVFPKVALGAQYAYGVFVKHESSEDAQGNKTSKFGFNIGNTNSGFGTASVLLNLYF